jgi:peptidyl-tRNA hydrolase
MDPAVYVLGRYDLEQKKALPDLLDRAAEACAVWLAEGIEAVMNRFNAAS